jgi:hypothetical protein
MLVAGVDFIELSREENFETGVATESVIDFARDDLRVAGFGGIDGGGGGREEAL